MAKFRKPASRKPSKKKLWKMEQKRKLQEATEKIRAREARYTRPVERSEAGIEACKQRLKDGKLCFCKERCDCRNCQAKNQRAGFHICDFETLKISGGCVHGCDICPEHIPCYSE